MNNLGRIKKHANKNEYLLTEAGIWVRNFHRLVVPYLDINKLTEESDYARILKNEIINGKTRHPWVDSEDLSHDEMVIVSDGYGFKEVHKILAKLNKRVAIMAVNGA